jgi:hypothetical protein
MARDIFLILADYRLRHLVNNENFIASIGDLLVAN